MTEGTESIQSDAVTANVEQGGPTSPTGPPVMFIYPEKTYKTYLVKAFCCFGGVGFLTPYLSPFPHFTEVPLIQPQDSALKQMIPQLLD